MKNIFSVLFATFFISSFAFAQITDPTPYCSASYHEEPTASDVKITNVKINAINNGSSTGNYTFYDEVGPTELVIGETYVITIETENADTSHALAAWIDFGGDGVFNTGDLLGDLVTPQAINDVNTFTFTVPATALEILTRLRVRVIEDNLYYNTNNQTNVPSCNSPYSYTLAGGGTSFEFANGETEDYSVVIAAVSSETTSLDIYSENQFNTIFFNGQTLQMFVDVLPSYLSQTVVWSVLDATGSAYITADGELVPLTNGTVSVVATSTIDGDEVQGALNVLILNQNIVIEFETEDDNEAICTGQAGQYEVDVDIRDNITEDFNFSIANLPTGTFALITPMSLNGSGSITIDVSNLNADEVSDTILLVASLDGASFSDTFELLLSTFESAPITPFQFTPDDNLINMPLLASFDWFDALRAYTYDLQIATDEDFNNIVVDQDEIFGSEYVLTSPLEFYTDYYWRVRSTNPCNSSAWSFVRMFKTVPNADILGCMDPTALNYDVNADLEDGSCLYEVSGCMDTLALNYNANAAIEDSTLCEYTAFIQYTILDDTTFNFSVVHSMGALNYVEWDYDDDSANEFNFTPSHSYSENGMYEVTAVLYSPTSGAVEATITIDFQGYGCTDPFSYNFSTAASVDDGTCELIEEGCTDQLADNYNPNANVDDGSCDAVEFGCTDETAFNYNPSATIDNGTCIDVVLGCTDVAALNYDSLANTNDGSCIAIVSGCMDEDAFNYNPNANVDDGYCIAVLEGCIDEDALNYNASANTDNGTCEYPIATTPDWTVNVNSENHTILIPLTADITVQGATIATGDYIGVFYTDINGDLACGGKLEWMGTTTTLTAYGTEDNEDNGFITGESFTWMVWDATDGLDHEAEVSYDATMPNTGNYGDDGISSILSLSTQITQTISLSTGWSLISTNLDPSNDLMDSVLSSISDDLFLAKDEDGDVFWPSFNINNIGDHTIGKAYKVRMDNDADLIISGSSVDPSQHELTLPQGWSYLGYLRKQPASASAVLASISSDIFIVKNGAGDVYWPAFNVNSIGNMTPGEGYQIRMYNEVDFNFPSNDLTLSLARLAEDNNSVEATFVTANNMTIGIPLDAWSSLPEEGTEVAILNDKGEVVGLSTFNLDHLVISVFGTDDYKTTIDEEETYQIALMNSNGFRILDEVKYSIGEAVYKTDDVQLLERIGLNTEAQNWEVISTANSTLLVDFNYADEVALQLELRDISGRLLFQSDVYQVEGQQLNVAIPNLPIGQYILSNSFEKGAGSTHMINIK